MIEDHSHIVVGDTIEVVIIKGWDSQNNRPSPIAKLSTGVTVLFGREFHDELTVGEVWEVQVQKISTSWVYCEPKKRVTASSHSKDVFSPEVAEVMLSAIYKELDAAEQELQELPGDIEKYKAIFEKDRQRLKELEEQVERVRHNVTGQDEQMQDMLDKKDTLTSRIAALKKALEKLAPQTVNLEQELIREKQEAK